MSEVTLDGYNLLKSGLTIGLSPDPDEPQKLVVHHTDGGRIASVSLSGNTYISTTDILGSRISALEEKINEEDEMDIAERCRKIMKLWSRDRKVKIDVELENKKQELINNDECVKILKEAQARMREIFKQERDNKVDVVFMYEKYITNETNKKLNAATEEYSKKYFEMENTCKEVEAMLEIAETYEQAIEILKDYDVINKKTGRINLD